MVVDLILVILLAMAAGFGFEFAMATLATQRVEALTMAFLIPRGSFSLALNTLIFSGNYKSAVALVGKVSIWEILLTIFVVAFAVEMIVSALFQALRKPPSGKKPPSEKK